MQDAATKGTGPRRFGSYELIEEIARGGMGVVWRARQDGLGREVALKMILSGRLATSAQVVRFYTEARAAARLDHPNIVPIFEIGEDEGCHFYSMRLMEGPSLARALKEGGRFPPARAARIVATVARAVHFAHQRGVLHRDVKPSNILLDAVSEPYVADFSLARIAEEDSRASRTDVVLGTPAYMAPEQASGPSRQVTIAADVYALGAVLYELLTGKPPFEADTPLKTLRLVTEAAPKSPRSLNAQIDRSLDVICLKCIQKLPEKRYGTAAELADDLERWLGGKPILARPSSSLEKLVSWGRRRPELAVLLSALSVVLAFLFVVSIAYFVRVRAESEARAVALRSEEAQRLAFQSLSVVDANPGQALLLALEAAERSSTLSSNNALLAALGKCRERQRFLGHALGLHTAAFSPDGEKVVTASRDGTARIWSASRGDALQILRGHTGGVLSAYFDAAGRRVVTASGDATARIWDAESGQQLVVLSGHVHPIKGAYFSPDGERVLTVSQNTARIWSSDTGAVEHVLDQHAREVICAAFSPDGGQVVTGSADTTAIIWDVDTGAFLRRLTGHNSPIFDVQYSVDGKRIATGSDPDARIWDSTSGAEL
ncbi:MAG TPA: serine/threonine-protein kinase, partial [Planctomycetota bacterium]|nr:serine/threonine-protein kinase [Planctomycetota bacterium]